MKVTSLVLCLTFVSGCAATDSSCARLPGNGRYCLQPADALAPFSAQQKVIVDSKGGRETMLASIESDRSALRFVGLSPFGQKLMHIECAGAQVKAPLWPHSNLDPALWCAMLQLTLWPADSVRAGLRPPLILQEHGEQRSVVAGDRMLLQAKRIGSQPPYERMQISMPTLELKLQIETLREAEAAR